MTKTKNSKSIYVFLPAYNEKEKVGEVIKGLNELDYNLKVHVVDDGSVDGTRQSAGELGARVIRHPTNLGQWAALRTGFVISLLEGADVVVSIDADGQHDPRDVGRLVDPIFEGEADIVIGSRFLNGDGPDMPKYRHIGINTFNKLVEIMTKKKLTDCTSGYKAYDLSLVRRILPHLKEDQYGALEFLVIALRHGARVIEKPIRMNSNSRSKKGKLKFGYNLLRTIVKQHLE